jgi:hypothetical protein
MQRRAKANEKLGIREGTGGGLASAMAAPAGPSSAHSTHGAYVDEVRPACADNALALSVPPSAPARRFHWTRSIALQPPPPHTHTKGHRVTTRGSSGGWVGD